MEETLFLEKIQNTFTRIEAIVDKWNIDYDLVIEINKEANVLEIEFENQIQTIAFPSISTGLYGYPIMQASKIALFEVMNFLK